MSDPEEKKNPLDKAISAAKDKQEAGKVSDHMAKAVKAAAERKAAQEAEAAKVAEHMAAAAEAAAARKLANAKKGIVQVRSLRIRDDHTTDSSLVGGLVGGDEVTIYETWSDGKDTWANLGEGQWAAMIYNGETYIKVAE